MQSRTRIWTVLWFIGLFGWAIGVAGFALSIFGCAIGVAHGQILVTVGQPHEPIDAAGQLQWRFGVTRFWSGPNWVGLRVAIPCWFVLLFFGVLTLVAWVRSRHIVPGRCRACGYDLTGNVSGRCPECGEAARGDAGGDGGEADAG